MRCHDNFNDATPGQRLNGWRTTGAVRVEHPIARQGQRENGDWPAVGRGAAPFAFFAPLIAEAGTWSVTNSAR